MLKKWTIKDIIVRYGTKSQLSVSEFFFLYNGDKVNYNLTFAEINDNDTEILLLVCPNKNIENENKTKKSDFIKCTKCYIPVL